MLCTTLLFKTSKRLGGIVCRPIAAIAATAAATANTTRRAIDQCLHCKKNTNTAAAIDMSCASIGCIGTRGRASGMSSPCPQQQERDRRLRADPGPSACSCRPGTAFQPNSFTQYGVESLLTPRHMYHRRIQQTINEIEISINMGRNPCPHPVVCSIDMYMQLTQHTSIGKYTKLRRWTPLIQTEIKTCNVRNDLTMDLLRATIMNSMQGRCHTSASPSSYSLPFGRPIGLNFLPILIGIPTNLILLCNICGPFRLPI